MKDTIIQDTPVGTLVEVHGALNSYGEPSRYRLYELYWKPAYFQRYGRARNNVPTTTHQSIIQDTPVWRSRNKSLLLRRLGQVEAKERRYGNNKGDQLWLAGFHPMDD
jgi:hypothetical protein